MWAEHNSNIQKHSARLIEYKIVEDSHEAENESLRKEKVAVLRGILSLQDRIAIANFFALALHRKSTAAMGLEDGR